MRGDAGIAQDADAPGNIRPQALVAVVRPFILRHRSRAP
jgi:hypothetical protein